MWNRGCLRLTGMGIGTVKLLGLLLLLVPAGLSYAEDSIASMQRIEMDESARAVLYASVPVILGDDLFVVDRQGILHSYRIIGDRLEELPGTLDLYSDPEVAMEDRFCSSRQSGLLDGMPWFIVAEQDTASFLVLMDSETKELKFRCAVNDNSLLDCISWNGKLMIFNSLSPVVQLVREVEGGFSFFVDSEPQQNVPSMQFSQLILPGGVVDLQFDGDHLFLLLKELATSRDMLLKLDEELNVLAQAWLHDESIELAHPLVGHQIGELYSPKYWYRESWSMACGSWGYPTDMMVRQDGMLWLWHEEELIRFDEELNVQSRMATGYPEGCYWQQGICLRNGELNLVYGAEGTGLPGYRLYPVSSPDGDYVAFDRLYTLGEHQQEVILLDTEIVIPGRELEISFPEAAQGDMYWNAWMDRDRLVMLEYDGALYQYLFQP